MKGEQIPLPMRVVHLAQDAEALARLRSPGEAISIIRERSGRAYDPALARRAGLGPVRQGEVYYGTLLLVDWTIRPVTTGRETSMTMRHYWRLRDGKVTYFRGSEDTELTAQTFAS